MRAHWIKDLIIQENYQVRDDAHHHLVHVVRIEVGDELLLLNGAGLFIETLVEKITKKELSLKLTSHNMKDRSFLYDLALAMPKREALELYKLSLSLGKSEAQSKIDELQKELS